MIVLIMADQIPEFAPTFRFQWEAAQNCHVVLYPEGMVKLSQSAEEILKRCDGQHTTAEIIAELQQAFNEQDLKNEIEHFIEQAIKNGWIRYK